ncbi:hypothetical protein Pcinc_017945 [Petrolisthes cinctipes]|uniref:Battenin n=1 Tax=Petrolisthes cinctipes TaxID=88211 RepID=A0AAE1FPP0_PETCI|nr:hypothetical protein Pcinc_017945 [Petrolisthes cinctipes]
MAPGPYNKTLVENGEGDHLYLLEGDLGIPKVSPHLSPLCTATPVQDQDEAQITLLKSTPQITSNTDHEHTATSLLLAEEENEEQEKAEGKRECLRTDGDGGKEKKGRKRRITADTTDSGPPKRVRDLVAFWLLGFCNNFTYWVMITAAYDLLSVQSQSWSHNLSDNSFPSFPDINSVQLPAPSPTTTYTERSQQPPPSTLYSNSSITEFIDTDATTTTTTTTTTTWDNDSTTTTTTTTTPTTFDNTFRCLRHSTGAILIADTLPATALTLAAPLTLLLGVWERVWLLTGLCVASYLTLGLATPSLVFVGVALASASRGFSDTTFLAQASSYHKHVLSLWSSGTGVATFVGPLLYSLMTTAGLDPRHVLLVFLTIPLLIIVSFSCVLSHVKKAEGSSEDVEGQQLAAVAVVMASEQDLEDKTQKTVALVKEKLYLFFRAQRYLLPLAVFYLTMYFTNQGLLELVYFLGRD